MTSFKNIALFSRRKVTAPMQETLLAVHTFLQQQGIAVFWEEKTAAALRITSGSILSVEQIGQQCDLTIVVGGDGSLLGAAAALVNYHIPILGINRGQLGFLTDINPQDLTTQLHEVLSGQYFEESRFLLKAEVKAADNGIVSSHIALNEITFYAAHAARLIEFEVYVDKQFVYRQRSDGLIVATPTGSTAYALSGGGPILHPSLECMVLVPMMPHNLTSRPIVINSQSVVDIVVLSNMEDKPDVSWDGHRAYSLNPQDRILICRHHNMLRLIHPADYDYYQTLRTKLQWGVT
jgi:NAD+ kinase